MTCLHCKSPVWARRLCRFHLNRFYHGVPMDRPRLVPKRRWGRPGSAQYRKAAREYGREQRRLNPEAERAYQRAWNAKNRKRLRAQDLARREAAKAYIIECKSVPCADCEHQYGPHVMDFDHVRGRKIANIGSGRFHGSMRALRKEIAKCDVVCSNCHREREYRRRLRNPNKWLRGWGRTGTTRVGDGR